MAKKNQHSGKRKQTVKSRETTEKVADFTSSGFWTNNLIPILILFVLPFALYGMSLGFEYVLDDKIVITDNDFTKKGFSGIWDILTTDSFEGYFGEQKTILAGGRYRPLSIITFAIEYQIFGLNPVAGHFFNILLYALSALLLFRVLLQLFPPLETSRWYLSLPFVASLLFVLHPVHTEVVANIKGRDEILALLFAFGALYFILKHLKNNSIPMLLGACISLLLGILAKENALTWLFIIPLSLYYFTKASWGQIAKITGALLLTVLLYFLIRYNALGYILYTGKESTDIMNNPFYGLDPGKRAATIMYTLGLYIKLLLYPHPLTHDYYPFQIPIIDFQDWRALLSVLVNLSLLIYALLGIRKKSIPSYAILFYFASLSIVSNIFVNVGTTMNERFIYMPSVGLCIILAYFIARWLPARLNEKPNEVNIISVGLLSVLCFAYVAKTLIRVPDWRNALTLNSAAVRFSPNSARANCFMGVAIFEDYKIETDANRKKQMLDDVSYYIDRALELYPAYGSALTMYSGVLAEHYKLDYDLDKLLAGFTEVLRYRTRTDFTDEYIQYLIDQNREPNKLASFLYVVGYNINLNGRSDSKTALHYLNFAYQVNPNDQNTIKAIVQCYQNLGNASAAQQYRNLLE